MDRATELKEDYEAMKQLMETFQHRETLRVEPIGGHTWFLFEKNQERSTISQCTAADIGDIADFWRGMGWTVTPVNVFRAGAAK